MDQDRIQISSASIDKVVNVLMDTWNKALELITSTKLILIDMYKLTELCLSKWYPSYEINFHHKKKCGPIELENFYRDKI